MCSLHTHSHHPPPYQLPRTSSRAQGESPCRRNQGAMAVTEPSSVSRRSTTSMSSTSRPTAPVSSKGPRSVLHPCLSLSQHRVDDCGDQCATDNSFALSTHEAMTTHTHTHSPNSVVVNALQARTNKPQLEYIRVSYPPPKHTHTHTHTHSRTRAFTTSAH